MNEQTELEDREMVEALQRTIPTVDTAYRAELRRRLAAMPEPKRRFAIGLRWPALSGAAAAVALILVLLNPFGQRSATPVSAKTLLEGAAQTAAHPGPYLATAMISTSGGGVGGSSLPPGLQRVTSDSTIFATYAVRDATHWRVELHTVRPALEAGTMTMAASGHSVVTYWSISRLAVSIPDIPGLLTPGFGTAFSMAGTIGTLVAAMNHPESGTHARLVGGERTILGRPAYLVRVWPASRTSTGPCTGVKDCLRKSHGFGYDLLWIDKEHLTTLRYEQRGTPSHVQRVLYRVTSITYGKGPAPAQLAYRPPVPVKPAGNGSTFSSSGGSTWGGTRRSWHPPAPFLGVAPPRDGQGHAFLQAYQGQAGQPGMTSSAEVSMLFAASVPNASPNLPQGTVKGPYVYIQERIRKNGMPPFFRTGIPHLSGGCPAWTGSYRNGIRWLGLQRGEISVMLSSNDFSEGQLVHYARAQLCR